MEMQQNRLYHFSTAVQQQLLYLEKEYNPRQDSWNIPQEEGIFLNLLVKLKKPTIIVEVGTSYGYSTVYLAEAAAAISAKLITIDINPTKTKIARQNMSNAGLSPVVEFITNDANTALKELFEKGMSPDFIFLDARKKDYLQQFKMIEKYAAKQCIVAADNAIDLADHMKDFLEYIQKNKKILQVIVPIGNGVALCYLR